MLFSDRPRTRYGNAPTHEVICQLRFSTILSINTTEPADFQEAIRGEFPQYVRRQDAPPPKVTGLGTPSAKLEQPSGTPSPRHRAESAPARYRTARTFTGIMCHLPNADPHRRPAA